MTRNSQVTLVVSLVTIELASAALAWRNLARHPDAPVRTVGTLWRSPAIAIIGRGARTKGAAGDAETSA